MIARFQKETDAVFFIDPPYTAGGKRAGSRLYTHSEIDHEQLFSVCEKLGGDFLMTYDNAEAVRALAEKHGFETKPVAMKNTHHADMDELLIGRNLDWVEEGGLFRKHHRPTKHKKIQDENESHRTCSSQNRRHIGSSASVSQAHDVELALEPAHPLVAKA